jgi:ATP-dependent RNA helicase RhlB
MDFHRFGIDARLAEAAEDIKIDFFYFEKLLTHAMANGENVCAKIALSEGREEVLLLPALQWLLSGGSRRALVLAQDSRSGDRCAEAIGRLGAHAGIGSCRAARGAEGALRLDGDPAAAILIGELDLLLANPEIDLREFGYLVVDGADRIAEQPPQSLQQFVAALLPSWERRSLLACAKISVKAKNLAWALTENPVEISIDGEAVKAQSVVKETWDLPGEDKLKFLLGLLEREKPERVCVFCNLKDTAKEVSRRLEANGVGSDYILGALAMDRKLAVLAKAKSGERPCLVLTDQGSEGLFDGSFPLVVNYDIPLEPEFFVRRIGMLDRSRPGAKVVSLACDRYIYGLAAVESYIDAKLDALPVDEALLAAEDKSEGMGADSREARGGEGRREGGNERRRGEERGDNRNPQRRDGGRRDANRRDSYARRDAFPREDRSPDIRRSISEATGGSLDIGGNVNPSEGKPRSQDAARRRQTSHGASDKDRRGQRAQGNSHKGGGPRGDRSNKPASRSAGPRRPSPRQSANDAPSTGNPYDTPIEERMKKYREKYGQDLGAKRQQGKPRQQQLKPQPPQAQAQKRTNDAYGQRERSGGPPPQRNPDSSPGKKPQGFFGQLFDSFKRKSS